MVTERQWIKKESKLSVNGKHGKRKKGKKHKKREERGLYDINEEKLIKPKGNKKEMGGKEKKRRFTKK